jgi:hypothetical protein
MAAKIDLDASSLAIGVVDYILQMDASPSSNMIVPEVSRPALIDFGRHDQ